MLVVKITLTSGNMTTSPSNHVALQAVLKGEGTSFNNTVLFSLATVRAIKYVSDYSSLELISARS